MAADTLRSFKVEGSVVKITARDVGLTVDTKSLRNILVFVIDTSRIDK